MSEHAVSEKPSPLARNPLDMIASAHAVQVQMCDAMERIADIEVHGGGAGAVAFVELIGEQVVFPDIFLRHA